MTSMIILIIASIVIAIIFNMLLGKSQEAVLRLLVCLIIAAASFILSDQVDKYILYKKIPKTEITLAGEQRFTFTKKSEIIIIDGEIKEILHLSETIEKIPDSK